MVPPGSARVATPGPTSRFDDVTALACQLCGTPAAAVDLVGSELPLHSVLPLRLCGRVPLVSREGDVIGNLSVFDHVPRQLDDGQRAALAMLGRLAGRQVEWDQQLEREAGRRRGEERCEALIRHGSDVIAVLDRDGRLQYASPSAEHLLGLRVEDWLGRSTFDFVHPSDVADVLGPWLDLVEQGHKSGPIPFRMARADGTWVEVEAVAQNLLQDEAVQGIVVNIRDITERRQAERATAEGEQRYRALVDSLDEGVVMVGTDRRVLAANPRAEEILGQLPGTLVGRPIRGFPSIGEDGEALPPGAHVVEVAMTTGQPSSGVVVGVVIGSDRVRWLRISSRPLVRPGRATPYAAVLSFTDISESREVQATLAREREFLAALLENLEEGIIGCDAQGTPTLVNAATRRLQGLPPGPIGPWSPVHNLLEVDGAPMAPERSPLARALAGQRVRGAELAVGSPELGTRRLMANGQPIVDGAGHKLGAVVVLHDVTEQRRQQEELARLALHDPLTGAANRVLLGDRLRLALDQAGRQESQVAVAVLDLDGFKGVNDRLGHEAGDQVLRAVADRLRSVLRPADTVARLGGDEFVVVCPLPGGAGVLPGLRDRLEVVLAPPYRVGDEGLEVEVRASLGVVVAQPGSSDPARLLRRADAAMYRDKRSLRATRA